MDTLFEPGGWGAELDYYIRMQEAGWRGVLSRLSYVEHLGEKTACQVYGSHAAYKAANVGTAKANLKKKYGPDWKKTVPFHY
jgi:hypothetical protein